MRLVLAALVVGCFAGSASASIQFTSISRGYTAANGPSYTNTTMGADSAVVSFGNGSASIDSWVDKYVLIFDGSASLTPGSSDSLLVFFNVAFTIDTPYRSSFYTGFEGSGNHSFGATLTGPVSLSSTNAGEFTSRKNDLPPGDYTFEAFLYVEDSGIASMDRWVAFTLNDQVPEASAAVTWSILALIGAAIPLAGRLRHRLLRQ